MAYGRIPYAPTQVYQPGDRIAELLQRRGEIQAEGALRSGDIWGNTIAGLGQAAGQYIGQRQEESKLKKRDAAWLSFVESGEWQQDPQAAYSFALKTFGPGEAENQLQGLYGFAKLAAGQVQDPLEALQKAREVASALDKLDDETVAMLWPTMRPVFGSVNMEIGEAFDPQQHRPIIRKLAVAEKKKRQIVESGTTVLGVPEEGPVEVLYKGEAPPDKRTAAERLADPATTPEERARLLSGERELAQARHIASAGGGAKRELTPNAESAIINRLSTQWTRAAAPAVEIDRQVKLMEAGLKAAKQGDMAAGSQAVLVTFQKILDPTSVVRESEYARSAAGQALLSRVQGAYEQLRSGGAGVPFGQLERFHALAKEAAKAFSGGHLDAVKKRIGATAQHYNIPEELVFEDYTFGHTGEAPSSGIPVGRFTVREKR